MKGGIKSKYTIVTNNPVIKEEFDNVHFIDGSFLDVLIKVRNMVHGGHVLISHPLGASVRMLFSPYRSILVGETNEKVNLFSLEIIEASIINYQKNMEKRNPDKKNAQDYSMIDRELLLSTLSNLTEMSQKAVL